MRGFIHVRLHDALQREAPHLQRSDVASRRVSRVHVPFKSFQKDTVPQTRFFRSIDSMTDFCIRVTETTNIETCHYARSPRFLPLGAPFDVCFVAPSGSRVQIEDVEDEDKRYALFLDLLEAAHQWEEFQLLSLLLQAWPPMMKEEVCAPPSYD
ncbi:Neuroblastoma-amplified sequence [Liparis tanakae]|uniref:Neuroblastoma-amplified sequence n=1 Tax=Liparis tanakae TaxID=230148 RepID=A0A4Z2I336_9TELE|nr:Neuroblastoma-amplified sequence [Liparis tanakae]